LISLRVIAPCRAFEFGLDQVLVGQCIAHVAGLARLVQEANLVLDTTDLGSGHQQHVSPNTQQAHAGLPQLALVLDMLGNYTQAHKPELGPTQKPQQLVAIDSS